MKGMAVEVALVVTVPAPAGTGVCEFTLAIAEVTRFKDTVTNLFAVVTDEPLDIDVMQYIAYIQRGDFEKAADISFDCLMCGLCVSRCPANIVHYNAALTARRLYSRYIAKPDAFLAERTKAIEAGECDAEIDALVNSNQAKLQEMYNTREIE